MSSPFVGPGDYVQLSPGGFVVFANPTDVDSDEHPDGRRTVRTRVVVAIEPGHDCDDVAAGPGDDCHGVSPYDDGGDYEPHDGPPRRRRRPPADRRLG